MSNIILNLLKGSRFWNISKNGN